MHPILLKIGPLSIYSYGVMVALGFGVGTFLISQRAASFGISKDHVLDLALVLLIGGLLGARLFYVVLNLDYFKAHPLEVFYLPHGGLSYHGAFISGVLVGAIYVKRKGISFWDMADLWAPYVALGQSIGRIGCFLNGCCYGREVHGEFPLRVYFPHDQVARHPSQMYSSLILLVLFLMLRLLQERRHFSGEVFLAYILAYSLQRFFTDFLRGDNPSALFGLTLSQLISAISFAGSLVVYLLFFIRWKSTHS
jgi:phosphatidylglycerol:prolipoprotein diacylglycerol transferase